MSSSPSSSAATTTAIPPVLVLSTGRCGSTMISDILNTHPRVLSLSEFFSTTGLAPFRHRRPSGAQMWRIYSAQSHRTRLMLRGDFDELLYPFDAPAARYTRADVPPLLCTTLPHLTDQYETLYDALAQTAPSWPRQTTADHFRQLFAWLGQRLGKDVWIERSGASLLLASRLLREFPEARVLHVYRDGRETALSMRGHYMFSMMVAAIRGLRSLGIDALRSMSQGRRWDSISPWLEVLYSRLFSPARLPYHKVQLADYGRFWSGMIERSQTLFQALPPDRLLNVKFEQVQTAPHPEIERIIKFISPELADAQWLQAAAQIPHPTTGRFAQLDAAAQADLTAACRPGLEILGYAV